MCGMGGGAAADSEGAGSSAAPSPSSDISEMSEGMVNSGGDGSMVSTAPSARSFSASDCASGSLAR